MHGVRLYGTPDTTEEGIVMSSVIDTEVPGSADLEQEVERRRRELAELEAKLAAWNATTAATT